MGTFHAGFRLLSGAENVSLSGVRLSSETPRQGVKHFLLSLIMLSDGRRLYTQKPGKMNKLVLVVLMVWAVCFHVYAEDTSRSIDEQTFREELTHQWKQFTEELMRLSLEQKDNSEELNRSIDQFEGTPATTLIQRMDELKSGIIELGYKKEKLYAGYLSYLQERLSELLDALPDNTGISDVQ